jgi:cytochrome c oxidase accessory protein FixG
MSSKQQGENFRDTVSTIDKQGKRAWIYPKKPKGWFYNKRTWATALFLLVFFGVPFLRHNGEPLFLLNVVERKFILFGQIFWPHDFILFGLGMIIFIVFIVLFTIVFGRVFCGWACPQTVFMEMVFRKIEYAIEGDYTKQKALDRMPWNAEKIRKKSFKWVVFYAISFLVGNTFLAYIIGVDALKEIITSPISQHKQGFLLMLLFSGIFFFVFTWFREQVCLVVCPYGRLQGVMLDRDSLVVAYDYERGEPRGKLRKHQERTEGDCIDCNQCVQVCPTGIDIRNGTQLECVNCTACIDACDAIMVQIDKPKGLVRYASENQISKKQKSTFTPRMMAYSVVLLLLVGVEAALLLSRSVVDANIIRTRGTLFYEDENGIKNIFTVKIVNKSNDTLPVTMKLEDKEGTAMFVGEQFVLLPNSASQSNAVIIVPKDKLTGRKTKIKVGLYNKSKKLQTVDVNFVGPTTTASTKP